MGTARAFNKWKIHTECIKKEESKLYSKNKKLKSVTSQIEKAQKKLDLLNSKKAEQDEFMKNLEQEQSLLEYSQLDKEVQRLEAENMGLRNQLDSTQQNVGSFINEMSGVLESHDIRQFFDLSELGINMQYDNMGSGTEEFEDTQQHAGTGGSSKIKSRPNQRRTNVYHNR